MQQSKEIYEGFRNLIKAKLSLSDEDIENMARLRYNICLECKSRKKISNICGECGCYLPAKTRSETSECPLKYWNSIL